MIIILNGSVGVGKSAVAEALYQKFERAMHLDGDAIGAVHPFQIYDAARVAHLYATLALLVGFHRNYDYTNFVINYVFESAQELDALTALLRPHDPQIHAFRLTCSAAVAAARIRSRARDYLDWELQRTVELAQIQDQAAQAGFIGTPLDTSELTAHEAAERIWQAIQREAA